MGRLTYEVDVAPEDGQGLAWLHANELGIDLVEPATGIAWRSVERDEAPIRRRLRHARMLLARPEGEEGTPPRLRLNREIRPYEWGWRLYATAIEDASPPPPGHIV